MARTLTSITRQRMSESAKARCTPQFRKRMSAIHSAKLDINEVVNLYNQGFSQSKVAEIMGVNQSVVSNWMRKHGIPARSRAPKGEYRERNRNWKGSSVKYAGLHARQYRKSERLNICSNCGIQAKTEWAKIDHDYTTDDNFTELCVKCHRNYDLGNIPIVIGGVLYDKNEVEKRLKDIRPVDDQGEGKN